MRTPLFEVYKDSARLIDFNGWEMPVWFSSIEKEHLSVRRNVGVFDISHMTRNIVKGEQAASYMDYLCGARISSLKVGQLGYTHVLNEKGGIIDDGIAFRVGSDEFIFVTNACTEPRTREWFPRIASEHGFKVEVWRDSQENAMLAVQGPSALQVVKEECGVDLWERQRFELVVRDKTVFSRSGYTGEDGAEIIGPGEKLREVFQRLLSRGVQPCGLGSRDTLRLEMGYPLACVDVDESVNPFEMGAQKFLDLQKEFVGRSALLNLSPSRRFRGVITEEPAVLRGGYEVEFPNGEPIRLTSGTMSPILRRGIGLGFFPATVQPGQPVTVRLRGRRVQGKVVKPPFLQK
jgi:aminomethyltransferase